MRITLDPYGVPQFGSVFFSHGTAAEISQKWLSRIQVAQQAMEQGADRVTTSPGQAAVANKQGWINAVTSTEVQNKWATNTARVTVDQWRAAYVAAIPQVGAAAARKVTKYEAALVPLLSYIDNGLPRIKSMDKSSFAARQQRMIAWSTYMHSYSRPAGS